MLISVSISVFAFRTPLYNSVFLLLEITLLYKLTAFHFFYAGLVLSFLCLPQRFTASCLFASIAYCGNIIRLCISIRSVVSIGSLCFSPLQLSVYHLPIARMHCPIYMYRAYLYAIIYIAFCRQCCTT